MLGAFQSAGGVISLLFPFNPMYIDTHAHLYGEEFKDDIDDVVERARRAGAERVFVPSTDLRSAHEAVALSRRYAGFCYPMIGLHPEDLPADYKAQLSAMEQELRTKHPYIGIGEVGLDYYWDASRAAEQREAFSVQIGWALRYGLPLMIHARKAHEDLCKCLRQADTERLSGVFHCFSGSAEQAAELMRFSHFGFGIGGVLTFKNSRLTKVLKTIPLERVVLETDAPYMAPVPYRGQRNEPSFLPAVVALMAEIYETTPDEVMRQTTENAYRLFPLAR